jgi:hypothetical protein
MEAIMFNSINPVNTIMQTALGGAGGVAGLAARNLVSSFGQNLIQKIGDMLNIPQPLIDAAQAQFAMASGDPLGGLTNIQEAAQGFVEAAGGSLTEGAEFGRDILDNLMKMASDIAGGEDAKEAKSGGKGGSWLMAMARALGKKADQLADQMQNFADKMAKDKSDPSASLEFSAKSQEFGLFMNAASNALKTAGESLTTSARKG